MSEWKTQKAWSDKFLPEIKSILGIHLIAEPPVEEDAQHNTDLIVLRLDAVRIACRVRRNQYLGGFGDEFTIRAGLPSGMKTELTKVVEGWGDYLFYAFADETETRLAKWTLADLRVFRLAFNQYLCRHDKGDIMGCRKDNHDGSSYFQVFLWSDFPPAFVIKTQILDTLPAATQ